MHTVQDDLLHIAIWKTKSLVSPFEWSRVHHAFNAPEPSVTGMTHKTTQNYKNSVDAHASHAAYFSQSQLLRSASWTLADHDNNTLKIGNIHWYFLGIFSLFSLCPFSATNKGSLSPPMMGFFFHKMRKRKKKISASCVSNTSDKRKNSFILRRTGWFNSKVRSRTSAALLVSWVFH